MKKSDFLSYIAKKVERSVDTVGVKNRASYIVAAWQRSGRTIRTQRYQKRARYAPKK